MKKASIALVMGLFMVLTACSGAEIENHTESFTGSYMASSTENLPMVGAWSPIQGDQDSEISQDALKAFEKATKDLEGKAEITGTEELLEAAVNMNHGADNIE